MRHTYTYDTVNYWYAWQLTITRVYVCVMAFVTALHVVMAMHYALAVTRVCVVTVLHMHL